MAMGECMSYWRTQTSSLQLFGLQVSGYLGPATFIQVT